MWPITCFLCFVFHAHLNVENLQLSNSYNVTWWGGGGILISTVLTASPINLFKMNMEEAIPKKLWITWHACGLLARTVTQRFCANFF